MANTRAAKINQIQRFIEWCKKVDKSTFYVSFTPEQQEAARNLRKDLVGELAKLTGEESEAKALDGLIDKAQKAQDEMYKVQIAKAAARIQADAKRQTPQKIPEGKTEADYKLNAAAGNWLAKREKWLSEQQQLTPKERFDLMERDVKTTASELGNAVAEMKALCKSVRKPQDFLSDMHTLAVSALERRLVKIFESAGSYSLDQILQLLQAEKESFERHKQLAEKLAGIATDYIEKESKQDKQHGKAGPKESAERVRTLAKDVYGDYATFAAAVTSLDRSSPNSALSVYRKLQERVLSDAGSIKAFMLWDVGDERRGEKYVREMRTQSKVIPSVLSERLQTFLDDENARFGEFVQAAAPSAEVKKQPESKQAAEVKSRKSFEPFPLTPAQRKKQTSFAEKMLDILVGAKFAQAPMNAVIATAGEEVGLHFPDPKHPFAKFLIEHFQFYKDMFARYNDAFIVQPDLVIFANTEVASDLLKKFIGLYQNIKYLDDYLRLKGEQRELAEDFPLDEFQDKRKKNKENLENLFKKGVEAPVHSLMPTQLVASDPGSTELYSDHLPLVTTIQVDQQHKIKLGTWNIMSPNQLNGFGFSADSASVAEAQERKNIEVARVQRIMQSIGTIIRQQNLDVMVLQEAETLDEAELRKEIAGWSIQKNGETWTLYNSAKLDLKAPVQEGKDAEQVEWTDADQEKYGFSRRPIMDELVFRVVNTNSYVVVNNVHYAFEKHEDKQTGEVFEGYPVSAETCTRALLAEDYRKKYREQIQNLKNKDTVVMPVVVGDMNAYLVPVHPEKNVYYNTGVRPPNATEGLQTPSFIDGCFTLGPDGTPYQQAVTIVSPKDGREHKESLPDQTHFSDQQWKKGFRENYVLPMTLDPRFKLFEPETVEYMASLGLRLYQSVTPLNQRFVVFKQMKLDGPLDAKRYDLAQRDLILADLTEFFGKDQAKGVQIEKDSHIAIPAELFPNFILDHQLRTVLKSKEAHWPKDAKQAGLIKSLFSVALMRARAYQQQTNTPDNFLKAKLELFRIYYALSLMTEKEGALVHPVMMLKADLIPKDKVTLGRVKREDALAAILDDSVAPLAKLYEMATQVKTEKPRIGKASRSRGPFLDAGLSKEELENSGFAKGRDAKAAVVSQAAEHKEVKQEFPEQDLQSLKRDFMQAFFETLAHCGHNQSPEAFNKMKDLFLANGIEFSVEGHGKLGVLHFVDSTNEFAQFLREYLKSTPVALFRVEADKISFELEKMAPQNARELISPSPASLAFPIIAINGAVKIYNDPSFLQKYRQLKLFKEYVPVLYPNHQDRGFLNELGNLPLTQQMDMLQQHPKLERDWEMVKEFSRMGDRNDFNYKRIIFGKLYRREKEAPDSKMFSLPQLAIDNAIKAAVTPQESKQEAAVDARAVAIARFLDMTPKMVKEFEQLFEKDAQAQASQQQPGSQERRP